MLNDHYLKTQIKILEIQQPPKKHCWQANKCSLVLKLLNKSRWSMNTSCYMHSLYRDWVKYMSHATSFVIKLITYTYRKCSGDVNQNLPVKNRWTNQSQNKNLIRVQQLGFSWANMQNNLAQNNTHAGRESAVTSPFPHLSSLIRQSILCKSQPSNYLVVLCS